MVHGTHDQRVAASLGALAPTATRRLASAAGLTARLASIAPERWAGTIRIEQVVELGVLVAGAGHRVVARRRPDDRSVCAGARALGRRCRR